MRNLAVLSALLCLVTSPMPSYVNMLTSGSGVIAIDRWSQGTPVRYWINLRANANINGSRAPESVITAAFAAWTTAPNTAVAVTRAGTSDKTANGYDDQNLICFVCAGDFSQEKETLAVTFNTVSDAPGQADRKGGTSTFVGQILDSDILFNPNVNFSTDGASGEDLQTVATHEIGHFFGLDHSGVVRAVMFPFSPSNQRRLSYDDVAGISSTYPKPVGDTPVGAISGSVRLPDGAAVFGAHVYAESASTNDVWGAAGIRKSPIGGITGTDGTFTIRNVPPDAYMIVAEPFDDPVSNEDLSYNFTFSRAVQTNFITRWY